MTGHRPRLADAIVALDERKQAALPEGATMADTIQGNTEQAGRLMLAGTDLAPQEANDLAHAAAHGFLPQLAAATIANVSPCIPLGGFWLDGVLTGLMLVELRQAHDARAEDAVDQRDRLDALAAAERVGRERERARIVEELGRIIHPSPEGYDELVEFLRGLQ